ncbi:MAG TPA: GGDEF domain-containing protein [Terriglobales bacterium]
MNKRHQGYSALILGAFVCLLLVLSGCARRGVNLALLESAKNVHEAAGDASNYGRPVRIQGVVTYYDPEWRLLFLQDASGGFFLNANENVANVKPGKLLEVSGKLAPSNIGIEDPEFRVLGDAPFPAPQALPNSSVDPTKLRLSQWVHVEGTIHAAWYEDGRLTLNIADGKQRARVRVLNRKQLRPIDLIGSKVKVAGVSAIATDDKGEPAGIQVLVSSVDDFQFDGKKIGNPFTTSPEPFSAALKQNAGTLVHLAGTVVEQKPGGVLFLSDGSSKVAAKLVDDSQLAPGDPAELVGFTSASHDYEIEDAIVRIVAPRLTLEDSHQNGTLRTLRELKSLTVEAASKNVSVDVTGTITFLDPSWSILFLQDKTAAAYVDIHSVNVEAHLGDVVRVQGFSAPGEYAPIITKPTITFLHKGSLPKPLQLSLQALSSGKFDSSLVEIHGVVHSVQLQSQHTFKLSIDGHNFAVEFPIMANTSKIQDQLLDAEVRVNAVCGAVFNEKRQLVGLKFFAPNVESVKIVESASIGSELKVRPIVTLLRFDPQNLSVHHVRIRGSVTLQDSDAGFYVQDSSAAIYVMPEQKTQLHAGEVVEVSGFPVADAEGPYLEDAVVSDLKKTSEVQPVKLDASELTTGLYGSQLVKVDGELLERTTGPQQEAMILRAGQLDLRVRLRGVKVAEEIRTGSLLEVTGILQAESWRDHHSFRIALRSPADVRVVSAASWWTAEHTVRVLTLAIIAILVVLLWVSYQAYRARTHEARHDPLTGLQNRGAALEYLERQLARAIREGSSIGIILADVDHFKRINDTFGHQAGDAVLEKIAVLLSADLRPYDLVGRYGGEEFLIIVPACDTRTAKEIAERIRSRIMEEQFFPTIPAESLPVTCSFGLAVANGASWDVDSILDSADRALYAAKNAGRNRVVFANSSFKKINPR